jgi:FkbM family methyltransferase
MLIDKNGTLSDRFVNLQKRTRPDFSIEIGAHAAEFSNYMASNFKIPAIAFEAGKDIYEKYKNTLEPLVSYVHCAISDFNGVATFFVHDDPLLGNNGIKRVAFTESHADSEVLCYKLDTQLKDSDFKNACLWIDVEGANREVLSGAKEVLSKVSSIFIETEDSPIWKDQWLTEDVTRFLAKFGFRNTHSEKVYSRQRNLIFVKPYRPR